MHRLGSHVPRVRARRQNEAKKLRQKPQQNGRSRGLANRGWHPVRCDFSFRAIVGYPDCSAAGLRLASNCHRADSARRCLVSIVSRQYAHTPIALVRTQGLLLIIPFVKRLIQPWPDILVHAEHVARIVFCFDLDQPVIVITAIGSTEEGFTLFALPRKVEISAAI